MDEVRGHLMAEHGFTLQCEGSVLYGLCRSCTAKEAETVHPAQTEKIVNPRLTRQKSRDTIRSRKSVDREK